MHKENLIKIFNYTYFLFKLIFFSYKKRNKNKNNIENKIFTLQSVLHSLL